jgi:hypothetical protein
VEHKAGHEKCQDFRFEMFGSKDLSYSKPAKAQPFEHGTSYAFICRSDLSGNEQVNLSRGAKTSRPSLHANSLRGCIVREKLMFRSSYSWQKRTSIRGAQSWEGHS